MNLDAIPVFKPNQALTAANLNDLREFLDQQDRLTRRALIGVGVLCGFRVDVDDEGRVLISRGVAVTTEGHLFAEDAVVCDRVTPYEVPLPSGSDVPPDQVAEARYPFLFPDGETQVDAWELLSTEAAVAEGEPEPEDITAAFLTDKTVMLFLEVTERALKSCDINDCSDKGAELQLVLRRLLVRRADADAMMSLEEQIAGRPTDRAHHPSLALPMLRVEDLGLARNAIASYPALFARILQIAARLGAELPKALRDAYDAYRHLLSDMYPEDQYPEGPFPDDFFGNVWGNLAVEPFLAQYFYGYMLDAVQAYNELVDAARALDCECLPNPDRFPRHVLLGDATAAPGGFVAEVSTPQELAAYDPLAASTGFGPGPRPPRRRTPWTPACTGPRLDDLRALFHRLTLLAHAFQLRGLLQEEIRVTPSRHDAAPLGSRCIPPYYAFTAQSDLFRVWSPEKTRANLLGTVYAHRFSARNGEHPYLYRVDGETFHAVAGHVGKSLDQALHELIVHKRVLGLDFAIEPVWMGLALADDGEGAKLDDAARERALEAVRKLVLCRMGDFEVVLLTLLAALFAFVVYIIRAVSRQLAGDHAKRTRLDQLELEPTDTTGRELAAHDLARLAAIARIDALRRPRAGAFTATRLDPKERREIGERSEELLRRFRASRPGKGEATEALAGEAGETSIAGIYRAVRDDADGGDLFERTRDRLGRLGVGTDNPEAAERVYNAVALLDAAETLAVEASARSLDDLDPRRLEAAYLSFSDRMEAYARTAPADPEDVDRTTAADNLAIADYAPAVAAQAVSFSSAGLLGEVKRRVRAIFEDLTLEGYARRHPGLEHRGGVPKGGTLVLAYVAKTELLELVRRAGPRLDKLTDSLRLETLGGGLGGQLASAAAQLLRAAGPRGEDPLSEFVVLADFCLPSKCCDSDCSDVVLEGRLPENLFDLDTPGSSAVDPVIPDGTPPRERPGFVPADREALRDLLGEIGVRPGRIAGDRARRRREEPDRPVERGIGVVAGRVTGAGSASTTPIPEAVITATEGAGGRTQRVANRRGTFTVRLPAGTYTFSARAEGFEDATEEVEVAPDATVEIALRLKRRR